ncbi:MAG: energy transducer TonB, partial [Aliarcobacter sp.]|nr:energy transducer TonB [Aliarcobacter sp.]
PISQSKKFQENIVKEQIINKNNSLQNSVLEDFLSQKEPINKEILSELERLYGQEYQNFTKVQKAYLEKNLNNFQVITQKVLNRLGYPRLAAKLKIGGTNIVEFMFHPDGSITNLKITNSSGYEIFDKYSLELIEIAYKDYPRPSTSTKLKFNVTYQIY